MPEGSPSTTISWQSVSDPSGVKGYRLERSADNANWEVLASDYQNTTYVDNDVFFGTLYFYRLAATDGAGNTSEYATVEFTTNEFTANAEEGSEVRATTQDGIVTFILSGTAVDEDVLCVAENYLSLGPSLTGYETIGGPYELVCKNKDGARLTDYQGALRASVQVPEDKKQATIEYYGLSGESWDKLEILNRDEQARHDSIAVNNSGVLIIMGKTKGKSAVLLVLLVLVALGAVVAGVLYGLNWYNRRRQQQKYSDYHRKSHGL